MLAGDGLPLCDDCLDYNYDEKTPFTSDSVDTPVAFSAFQHTDGDIPFDPLSTNCHLQTDIAVLGTVILAGPTPESIQVLLPDCLSPPVGNVARIDVIELRLGSPSLWMDIALARRSGQEQLLHYNREPGLCTVAPFLHHSGCCITVAL